MLKIIINIVIIIKFIIIINTITITYIESKNDQI